MDNHLRSSAKSPIASRWIRFVLGLVMLGLLGACGFRLKGDSRLAFDSVAIQPEPGSEFVVALRQALERSVSVLSGPRASTQAQLILDILEEQRSSTPVGKTSSGQIREIQLMMRVRFRVVTPTGRELIAPTELVREQELSYNETQALSKSNEQAALFRQIQDDMVRQILRRLSVLQKPT